jgi:uncharacterized protein (DUF305 family)
VFVSAFAWVAPPAVQGQQPVIIQPGPPGEPGREITAEEASNLAGILYTQADVKFMQGMISHHAQALTMTDLVGERSQSPDLHSLAKRIELSQADEIDMMQEWLRSQGEEVTAIDAHHAHGAELMPGMLTPEQMQSLEQAASVDFDRLFLEYMISHHQGALMMVEDLLSNPRAAQESTVFGFAADIIADQSMEIDRMAGMLAGLSNDPRVGLAAGFLDAEQALWNLELLAALPKPPGFFAPDSPGGLAVPPDEDKLQKKMMRRRQALSPKESEEGPATKKTTPELERKRAQASGARTSAVLNFSNSDLAFAGNVLIQGNFHGFNTFDITNPELPRLMGSVVCPGGQGDVSIVGDLLVLSVEQTRGRLDCGLQGVPEPVSDSRFRGIRIFDISDLAVPKQVAAVQTCRGSHTHTVVTDPDDEGNFYVYGSGTASVRAGDELDGCSAAHPGEDENTALFSIDVIQVPVQRPQDARVVSRPRIFADPETGAIAGLWKGGDHGAGTQTTSQTNQCHDITVYPEIGLAAGACSGNGILLDISDPVKPVRLHHVVDEGFAYWHSATFNNDGTKVVFTDEWGGGMRPRCRASDPKDWGANAIFDVIDRKLVFRSYYKLPAPQSVQENCVAHNGSLVPVPGRDIMVQAWYQGGLSVFDFTDSDNPYEIAYFDRGPIDADKLVMGGHWSAYWHNGHVYGAEIARGLDVLRLLPSDFLTQAEIDAAGLIEADLVNAQHQRRIDWPASPAVARAYVDQLERTGTLPERIAAELSLSLAAAEQALGGDGSTGRGVVGELVEQATELQTVEAAGRDGARLEALAETVTALAQSLR